MYRGKTVSISLDRLVYWIEERYNIYLQHKAGKPKPWTTDPILQSYRFCNVRRMDDRVSQWLWNNWYKPYFNHPHMLPAIVLARFINLPSSLEVVGFPARWNRGVIKRRLYSVRNRGWNVFNSAYMVRGNDGSDKIASVVDFNVHHFYTNPPELNTSSMQRCWEAIVPRYGMGSFMAGQVVADLRWAISGTWRDRRKWAPMGPGSRRGLNRLLGRGLRQPMKQDEFLKELRALVDHLKKRLPSRITRRMEMIDWQNCLCEFDKYERVRLGQGRPKSRYPGRC